MEKYHVSSVIQDFVFSSRKKGCIGCISRQEYNKILYFHILIDYEFTCCIGNIVDPDQLFQKPAALELHCLHES